VKSPSHVAPAKAGAQGNCSGPASLDSRFRENDERGAGAQDDSQQRYAANLQGEIDSATLYRTLSESEKNPELAQVYGRLAAVEEAHAEFWKRKIDAIGQCVPMLRPSLRTRTLTWLARRFGPAFVLPTINTLEQRRDDRAAGGPASRVGRQCAACRGARRE
jgi:hypothetical protein